MAKKISYFHPGEPNARSFQCGTDSLHGSLSICPLECRINRLHKRIQSIRSTVGYLINYKRLDNLLSKCIDRGERKIILIVEHLA